MQGLTDTAPGIAANVRTQSRSLNQPVIVWKDRDAARAAGMAEKSREFVEKGAEAYAKA